ncbi:hypothetical protein BRADI_1g50995v3 [Brachypodium distachyon]|uniref:Uncharacterized protein n=1 Tax=Brachypodium distachyon TaxID=15368 RepID=A0A0Q3S3S6_BRADI|nr:hypothetical protein BRADI_1g50995v3 [Brachypodium distachyon]
MRVAWLQTWPKSWRSVEAASCHESLYLLKTRWFISFDTFQITQMRRRLRRFSSWPQTACLTLLLLIDTSTSLWRSCVELSWIFVTTVIRRVLRIVSRSLLNLMLCNFRKESGIFCIC